MFQYPMLSPLEQAELPSLLEAPKKMPAKFEDSTHQLWHCVTVEGAMVLKVCDQASVEHSDFWLGLNHLFGSRFPQQLGSTPTTAKLLATNGTFTIPDVIAAEDQRFVLTRFVAGEDLVAMNVNDADVKQLAQHLAALHAHHFTEWGDLHIPKFSADAWRARLANTLQTLVVKRDAIVPAELLNEVLATIEQIEATDFVVMMPDLRWDQLRRTKAKQTLALVDLDAFVIGPRALDLVLIMYLLTPAQLVIFRQLYCQSHRWPDLGRERLPYQLLLFLMNVLGETNLNRWMERLS